MLWRLIDLRYETAVGLVAENGRKVPVKNNNGVC